MSDGEALYFKTMSMVVWILAAAALGIVLLVAISGLLTGPAQKPHYTYTAEELRAYDQQQIDQYWEQFSDIEVRPIIVRHMDWAI